MLILFMMECNRHKDTSYDDFVEIVQKLGQSKKMADFLFYKVSFEIDLTDAEARPWELFMGSLSRNYPVLGKLSLDFSEAAYSRLVKLVQSRKNQPIYRRELEEAIWKSVEAEYLPDPSVRIHTIHDDSDTGPGGSSSSTGNRVSAGVHVIFHRRRNGTNRSLRSPINKGMAYFNTVPSTPPPEWTSQVVCSHCYRYCLFRGFWLCDWNGDEGGNLVY